MRTASFRKTVPVFFTRDEVEALRGHNLATNTYYLLRPDGSQDAVPLTSSQADSHVRGGVRKDIGIN